MVAGLEQARITNEFENQIVKPGKPNHLQLEQSHSAQILFQKQVNNLLPCETHLRRIQMNLLFLMLETVLQLTTC